jgi:hypothetical protein
MGRLRIGLLTAVAAAALGLPAPAALACVRGYSYAGLYGSASASGVGATLSMLEDPSVADGHVAAWVGVGGPGLGPNGSDEWLQVGLASFAGSPEGHLYYELALPGRKPRYNELGRDISPGEKVRVAVLELPFVRDTWIVVSNVGLAGPFYLPHSHGAWQPVATAESWDAGGTQCNRYAYRFAAVQVAGPSGSWHALRHGLKLQDAGRQLRRYTPSTFVASAA